MAQTTPNAGERRALQRVLVRGKGTGKLVPVLRTEHFAGLGHERLAQSLAGPFDLRFRPHPIDRPEGAINVFWHAKVHRSPARQWQRGMAFELSGDETGTSASKTRTSD